MTTDQERWRRFGEQLGAHRRRLRMSKRAAAARAGFSEGTWRKLEEGAHRGARLENLRAAAEAVDWALDEASMILGLDLGQAPPPPPADPVTQLVAEIGAELRGIRQEVRRLGDAYEQLAGRPLAPSPSAGPGARLASVGAPSASSSTPQREAPPHP